MLFVGIYFLGQTIEFQYKLITESIKGFRPIQLNEGHIPLRLEEEMLVGRESEQNFRHANKKLSNYEIKLL